MARAALGLRTHGQSSGIVSLVGLRRPFSPQAERLPEAEFVMKKAKGPAEQPVGIVIATGGVAPSNPRVKAYFWFEEPAPGPEENEK